jgi:hypothetical protein
VLQTLVRVTHTHVLIHSVTSSIVGLILSLLGERAKLELEDQNLIFWGPFGEAKGMAPDLCLSVALV